MTLSSISIHNPIIATVNNQSSGYTAVLGKGMLKNNVLLPALLGNQVTRWYPWYKITKRGEQLPQHFAGWGQKKSFKRAKKAADKLKVSTLSVEDGFLRSINSGIHSRYGCSVVVDDIGIYFNLHHQSKLENDIIYRAKRWSTEHESRAQTLIDSIISYRLSKYNSTDYCPNLNQFSENDFSEHILLIDQVAGDASIKGSGADEKQFEKMLIVACQQHPNAKIWIKAHPAGKTGYLNDPKVLRKLKARDRQRVAIINTPVNPIKLIEQVSCVYSVSSHMGFEALMLNKTVCCFGVSWYSGWGLTQDQYAPQKLLKKVIARRSQLLNSFTSKQDVKPPKVYSRFSFKNRRGRGWFNKKNQTPTVLPQSISLHRLFYAAYIDYSRYADPASGQRCDVEQVIHWLYTNRNWYLKLPANMTVFQFSRWKTGFVTEFLSAIKNHSEHSIRFKKKPKFAFMQRNQRFNVDLSHDLLVWGLASRHKVHKLVSKKLTASNQPINKLQTTPDIWCMEDGFIRSNGLGATLLEPLSVVIDKQGIYYDATQPSDLESLLAQCKPLNNAQMNRVEQLHQKLLEQRVSKYHVGQPAKLSIPQSLHKSGKPIILVVGQVEDDLSVQYCGSTVKTNSDLIQSVRANNPNAYLIYKPHPDVEMGLRFGKVDKDVLQLVDDVAYDVAMPNCLDVVDEIHTISSLTGFEALLRGKQVSCYGLPFYAGWGLTTELDSVVEPKASLLARRQKSRQSLTLEQLIYCTLIEYPLYRLPNGHGYAQVEQVIDYLYPTQKSTNSTESQAVNNIASIDSVTAINKDGLNHKKQPITQSPKRILATKVMQARNRLKNLGKERIK